MFRFLKIALCLLSVLTGGYAQADQQWQVLPEKSRVGFIVHSTLHEVNGKARKLSGGFEQKGNLAKGAIDVDVAGLTTANKARDKNMYRMFDVSRYAKVHFNFDNTDITNVLDRHEGEIRFSGVMTIHNISHPMTILSKEHREGSAFVCEGRLLIHLKDYALKPPSILGLIRVRDEVQVEYSIVFVNKANANDNS